MRAWIDGRTLESPDEPALSVLDHGLVVGDGVFETVKVEEGVPFALERHLLRLARSAIGLGLDAPDLDALRSGVASCLAGQDLVFGRIRITLTSGRGPLGSPRGGGAPTAIVVVEPATRPGPTTSVVSVPWTRNERGALTGLKTTSYAENAVMIEYARARGATEALIPNTAGLLCEGTGSNVFYVLDGQLVTPTLESGCLAGVTRALVLEWCRDEVDVVERDEPIEVLQRAEEVFLVGTTRDVQAVHRVDERDLPAPGPVTKLVASIWARQAPLHPEP
ncbi:UNVERIFIED_CONTAM: class IV aminotransferase [Mumia flava]|nr:aminodeoxychorismate lyase [Mumia flava]